MLSNYHEWAGRAPAYAQTPVRRVLGVPLKGGERVIGVINVGDDQRSDPFSEDEVRVVELFADQAAIAVANARLVASLRERTAELEARNAELDAFAHTVAHDLKNPLAHIVGYAQLLAEGLTEMLDDEKRDCLGYVARTAVKMSNIVDELLLLAEVRKMDIELAPLDMAGIVDEAQTRLAHMIAERHAEIIAPAAWPPALGYAAWVEEVWVNYLSNALKYGGTPPRVELGFSTADRASQTADLSIAGERFEIRNPKSEIQNPKSEIRFWVRDNGPGFNVADPEQLFLPFTRLNQVHAQGHGLGLSIVRCIVEKLGGQVAVESVAGQGSVFSFTLPASETAFSG
jgi:signal transduction histidine kinase